MKTAARRNKKPTAWVYWLTGFISGYFMAALVVAKHWGCLP